MSRYFPPVPKWEALQEPEQSSSDELDTEDGDVGTPGSAQARPKTQRTRDGRPETTRDLPQPAATMPSTSTIAVVSDTSRSQMKRKESESLFTSKKRARYAQAKPIPPDAEIIEIFDDDDDDLPQSISQAKSESKPIRRSPSKSLSAPGHSRYRTTRIASTSASSSATKKFLPKAPIEVIEILDSDDEQLPLKAQGEKRGLSGSRVSELAQEHASGSNPPSTTSLSRPNSVRKPFIASSSSSAGPRTESTSSRLGFSPVGTPSSLQAPPPPDKRLNQFARKMATQAVSDEDEDVGDVSSGHSKKANTKANKGKEKEARESSSSSFSSGTESISMRGLQNALAVDSDKTKPPLVTPTLPRKQGQTLAEAITSAGQLNYMKTKIGRRMRGNTEDMPIDLMSDVEADAKDATVDENKKALKAAIGSSRRLVNLLPTLKGKNSVRATATAEASSPRKKSLSSSPTRTQNFHTEVELPESPSTKIERSPYPLSSPSPKRSTAHDDPSPKPPSTLLAEMKLKSGSPVGKIFGSTDAIAPPKREPSTAYEFKSGTAVIGPPKIAPPNRIPLPKRPSPATIERKLAAARDNSRASRQTTPAIGLSGESNGDVVMADVPSISPLSASMSAVSPSAARLMTPSSIPLPLSPSQPVLQSSLSSIPNKPTSAITPSSTPLPLSPLQQPVLQNSLTSMLTESTSTTTPSSIPLPLSPLQPVSQNNLTSILTEFTSMTSPASTPLPLSPLQPALQRSLTSISMLTESIKMLTPSKVPPLARTEVSSGDIDSSTLSQQTSSTTVISSPTSSSPKLADVQPITLSDSNDVRAQSLDRQPSPATAATTPKSPEPPVTTPISAETTSSPPLRQSPAVNDSIAALEAIQISNTLLSIHSPASTTAPTSPSNAAVQDGIFDALDEQECQALLQTPDYMDVVPSHDVQPALQDSIVVRRKSHINVDTSVTSSMPLTSTSATTELSDEHVSVSLPTPEVSTRRSTRSSGRTSRSSSTGGLGTAFDYDFGPFDSVPVTRTPTPEVQELSVLPSPPKTYGGFRALTWKDFRKDLNNFIPRTYFAKDLPHALQDHINSMSEHTQMLAGMRDLFKATMLENTVEDEPDAPPIEILNSVDAQPTPPWEFYYTNNMWLGEEVPPPDIKKLVSCTCKGGCNPKSKTCACLMRQREATGDPLLEFAYDKNGKLKIPGYPIFECNDLCGCSDECRNRVVQHGRKVSVNIGKTELKGWGVFAGPKRIPGGTYLGIYSGELLTDAEAHERGIVYNKSGRTYLFDIDFHHLKEGNSDWEIQFTVDAYHAGNFTRFLNHSCDPNCRLYACYINEGNIQKPLLAVFTRRDIEPYEEICFNYQGIYDDEDEDEDEDLEDNIDPDHGKDMIYVQCQCGAKNCRKGPMFK